MEVGGEIDEVHVTLAVYGPELDPDVISSLLGCPPTHAHRRGEQRGAARSPWPQGAWLLTLEGEPPITPDELAQRLLRQLPLDPGFWRELASKYEVRITFSIFMAAWSRGFELAPATVRLLETVGVPVGFSIYAEAAP